MLIDREAAEQAKDHAQRSLADFCRKLASAIDSHEEPKPDNLLKKVYDMYQVGFPNFRCSFLMNSFLDLVYSLQENSRYKLKIAALKQTIESLENECKIHSDMISRMNNEKDSLNQQLVQHLTTIDLLKRVCTQKDLDQTLCH